jgi:multicomponent Na+:H+ antiporter subunit A
MQLGVFYCLASKVRDVPMESFLQALPQGFSSGPQDEWSLLFQYLILGIGALIAVYAWAYFPKAAKRARFFAAFLPFAAAMYGIVSLDHWLLVFLCWEATSILSFFLISFYGEKSEARKGATHAALITGAGGLAMLGAILLLGTQYGVWTVSQTLTLRWSDLPLGPVIGGLFLFAALTKSAQFPFHFWLGGAMTAPTPASAYLHSATMVKAGIFLLLRLQPTFQGSDDLLKLMFLAGSITFLWGSLKSIFQFDLKAVLAGTTIANLGFMVALIAYGGMNEWSMVAGLMPFLIIAHATYKAGLFLFSGLVEIVGGSRRLDQLQGLRTRHPWLFVLGLSLAAANLGLPFSLGYLPKALLDLPLLAKIVSYVCFFLMAKAGILVAVRPFLGTGLKNLDGSTQISFGLWLPPAFLAAFSFLGYFLVVHWENTHLLWLQRSGAHREGAVGLSLSLLLSLAVLAASAFSSFRWNPGWAAWWESLRRPQGSPLFESSWQKLISGGKVFTLLVHNGSLSFYLSFLFLLLGIGMAILAPIGTLTQDSLPFSPLMSLLVFAKVGGVVLAVQARKPVQAVLYLGLVGYSLALLFALLGAPDLAMTQFAVESISVVVLLLCLKGAAPFAATPLLKRWTRALIGSFVGLTTSIAVYFASEQLHPSRLRDFFSQSSWLEAHGRNVVNVILVDFRALDTMGEISVLVVAAFGASALLSTRRNA